MMQVPSNGVYLPRKVGLATLVLLIGQVLAFSWFMATLNARVVANEEFRKNTREIISVIGRMDEQFVGVRRDLDRIDGTIRGLTFSINRAEDGRRNRDGD